jgi:hypothetical protein
LGEGVRDVPTATVDQIETVELAAVSRPHPGETAMRRTVTPAEPAVSPVSAYAPTRYDGQAGFMSGRGLY